MKNKIVLALILVLAALGSINLIRGLTLLGFSQQPTDLFLRWRENVYVSKGINPYDLSEELFQIKQGKPQSEVSGQIDPLLSATWVGSGYPPWAFLWSSIFIPPISWEISRIVFTLFSLFALAHLAIFVWRQTAGINPNLRLLVLVGISSISSIGTTLGNGQWGLILASLLIVCINSLNSNKRWIAGLSFGLTALKPTCIFAFIGVFLKKDNFGALCLAGGATLSAGILVAAYVESDIVSMLSQMMRQTSRWEDASYSLPDLLSSFGAPRGIALASCLVFGVASGAFFLSISNNIVYQLAVGATISRLLSYHQLYDNMLLLFLLLAIAVLSIKRPHVLYTAMSLLLWMSLALPGRITEIALVQNIQLLIWFSSLSVVIVGYHSIESFSKSKHLSFNSA